MIVSLKATIHKWRIRFCCRGVQFFSAVYCTPLRSSMWCVHRSSQRCDAHCGDILPGMLHTTEIISAVCCTPRRSSLLYVAHRGDHLRGGLHTRETALWSNSSTKLKPNSKIREPVYQRPRWVQIMKTGDLKSRYTLHLRINDRPHNK